MRPLRIPFALATSVVALFSTSASSAQETTERTNKEQTTTTTTSPPTTTPPRGRSRRSLRRRRRLRLTARRSEDRERTIEHRPNRSMLSTGTGLFIISYGSSALAAAVSDRDANKRLFIPVVGPWINLTDRGCNAERPCGANEDVAKAMIITSGVVQGAGVLLALGSLIIPESTTTTERARSAKLAERKVHVFPISLGAGAGLGAVGRF